jgi:cytochrome P450
MTVLINPLDPDFQQNPYPKYAELRREAPVYRHPAGFVAVSRYRDVVEVLRSPERFSSKAMGGMDMPAGGNEFNPSQGSLIGKDPPVHTRMRNIVNRGFTPRRIAKLESRIQEVIDELFAAFGAAGRCDLTRDLASPMPIVMIAELLGLDPRMRDDFKRWAHSLLIGSTRMGSMGERGKILDDVLEFSRFMRQVTEERRKSPGDDLISLLIHAEEEEGILAPEEVVGFASLLLFAGSETTTNLIGNAVLALLGHPELRERVDADRTLIPALLEETLRWDSPIQLVMRLVTEDTELAGVALPRHSMALALLASANRDDAQFPDADSFDVDRNAQGHLGFGHGHHFCLGAALARLQARLALEAIFERLEGFELPSGLTPQSVARHGSLLVRGPAELPLVFSG